MFELVLSETRWVDVGHDPTLHPYKVSPLLEISCSQTERYMKNLTFTSEVTNTFDRRSRGEDLRGKVIRGLRQ